ncbi:MAG: DUF115 domain-containing protein, partial [Victivallales bacterium]|nr:DUF115 domain-containing protein [Victivallales bacterium]
MDAAFDGQLRHLMAAAEQYPSGNTLYVYLGMETDDPARLRSRLPSHAPLLFFAAASGRLSEQTAASILIISRHDPGWDDKLALAINCLHPERVKLAHSDRYPGGASEPFAVAVATRCRQLITADRQFRRSELWNLRCAWRNWPWLAAGVPTIRGTGRCVICGAGPSLVGQLATLRRERDRFFLVAVGKLAPQLAAAGIRSDAVVYVDHSGYGLDWTAALGPETLLVAFPGTAPEVCRAAHRIYFGAGPSPYWRRALTEWGLTLPELAHGGTATLTAIDFARRAGFTAIALIGNDLCLGADGASHLPGYSNEAEFSPHTVTVAGNLGPVTSTPELLQLQQYLEAYLAATPGVPVINCTVGGAVIHGCPHRAWEDWLATNTGKPEFRFEPGCSWGPPVWSRYFDAAVRELAVMAVSLLPLSEDCRHNYQEFRRHAVSQLTAWFAADLKRDFAAATTGEPSGYDLSFTAYREAGAALVRPRNPELADYLRQRRSAPVGFELDYHYDEFAYIVRRTPAGAVPLTADFLHVEAAAEAELASWLKTTSFDPMHDAVIVVAPASWLAVAALGRRYPDAVVIALTPWPELLAEVWSHTLVPLRLPPDLTVVAATENFPRWRRQYRRRVGELQR